MNIAAGKRRLDRLVCSDSYNSCYSWFVPFLLPVFFFLPPRLRVKLLSLRGVKRWIHPSVGWEFASEKSAQERLGKTHET
jgi:hypothetical protein